MTTLQINELARKISLLQNYTASTGVKTTRSQAELLRNLSTDETVLVLETVAAGFREKAAR